MICSYCGKENKETDNFCAFCGKKLKKKCKCWVNKKDNYNCGKDSCPGYGLFKLQKLKSK